MVCLSGIVRHTGPYLQKRTRHNAIPPEGAMFPQDLLLKLRRLR